jgi:hypothetical protein
VCVCVCVCVCACVCVCVCVRASGLAMRECTAASQARRAHSNCEAHLLWLEVVSNRVLVFVRAKRLEHRAEPCMWSACVADAAVLRERRLDCGDDAKLACEMLKGSLAQLLDCLVAS